VSTGVEDVERIPESFAHSLQKFVHRCSCEIANNVLNSAKGAKHYLQIACIQDSKCAGSQAHYSLCICYRYFGMTW
jgi:hypothetical protein